MTFHSAPSNSHRNSEPHPNMSKGDPHLRKFVHRLSQKIERDALVQKTTDELREFLQVDRVVLYYFYSEWKGQITFESLSTKKLSILGSSGPDECFNGEYAAMYSAGRVRAIPDVEVEPIHECHRKFLRYLGVKANLVVPILTPTRLWGLLIAHHCDDIRPWLNSDIEMMQKGAENIAHSPAVRDS